MKYEILFVFVVALFLFLRFYLRNKTGEHNLSERYQVKTSIFTKSEYVFYKELQGALGRDFWIFPKVRIIDFIKEKNFKDANKIIRKHVDFLICDKSAKPICVVELDGKSHSNNKQMKSDEFKNKLFSDLNICFHRVKVGKDFKEEMELIYNKLKD